MSRRGVAERVHALLLHLYPAGFRSRYGAEARDTFARRLALERRRSGTVAALLFAARACADVPFSALRVRLRGGFGDDVRYARRTLRHSPAFTLTAVGILAMGIGAGVAVFGVLDAVVLAPLPYAQPDRLVTVWMLNINQQLPDGASWPTIQDWRARSETLREVAAYYRPQFTQRTLAGDARPIRLQAGAVTPNFFEVLGVEPALGRTFSDDENAAAAPVALISHRLWQQRFGGDPGVVGERLQLDGATVRVIGVMPPTVRLPTPDTDIWEPLFRYLPEDGRTNRWWDALVGLARLGDDVSLEQARADIGALTDRLRGEYPEELFGLGALMTPLSAEVMGARVPQALWFLFAAVLCVLLVACTNVANLVVARGLDRGHEFAVRTAMGAGRGQLVRQLMVENGLLSLAGAALGLTLGIVGMRALVLVAPADTPRLDEVAVSGGIIAAVLVGALLLGPVFGLPAALWAVRRSPQEALKSGLRTSPSRGQRRLRGTLVVAEVALAVVLMAGGLLLTRSLSNVWGVDAGFDPERTLVMKVDLVGPDYATGAQVRAFYLSAIDAVRAVPGVASAGAVTDVFRSRFPDAEITPEGHEPPPNEALRPPLITDWVIPGYFEAMGIELLRGRAFEPHELGDVDRSPPGVVIINKTMADTFWPDEDPVGERFQWGSPHPDKDWLTVVGVVADTRGGPLDEIPISRTYTPFLSSRMHLVVRTDTEPELLIPSIDDAVHGVDAEVALSNVMSAAAWYADSVAQRKFQTMVLLLFAVAAVVLAATGIYGVMHDSVVRRSREIGIRMAVGADAGTVLRMVLGEGLLLAAVGLSLGLAGAVALSDVVATFLYEVSPTDPAALLVAAVALLGVATLATALPARRATRVDPIETLHD